MCFPRPQLQELPRDDSVDAPTGLWRTSCGRRTTSHKRPRPALPPEGDAFPGPSGGRAPYPKLLSTPSPSPPLSVAQTLELSVGNEKALQQAKSHGQNRTRSGLLQSSRTLLQHTPAPLTLCDHPIEGSYHNILGRVPPLISAMKHPNCPQTVQSGA